MARFRYDQADNYGGNGGSGFFGISEDMGVKRVRFLYNHVDDMEGMSVHKVQVGEKERYVNCLREYNEPMDNCPFCKAGYPTQAKLFIPLYNIEEDQVQIWDRGKKMFAKMSGLFSRYGQDSELVSHVFEIERHGKPKDTATQYEIFEVDHDDTTLEDLPELPVTLGGLVLDKSFEDMQAYVEDGCFPDQPEDGGERERPTRRSSESSRGVERRTPASTGRGASSSGRRERF